MAMSAEHRSKFEALHRQWWPLHMSEKFSSGTRNPKQTNKQTKYNVPNFTSLFTAVYLAITFALYWVSISLFIAVYLAFTLTMYMYLNPSLYLEPCTSPYCIYIVFNFHLSVYSRVPGYYMYNVSLFTAVYLAITCTMSLCLQPCTWLLHVQCLSVYSRVPGYYMYNVSLFTAVYLAITCTMSLCLQPCTWLSRCVSVSFRVSCPFSSCPSVSKTPQNHFRNGEKKSLPTVSFLYPAWKSAAIVCYRTEIGPLVTMWQLAVKKTLTIVVTSV